MTEEMRNPETITGYVEQHDIDEGVESDHEQCALAQAVSRMFPECVTFVDDYLSIYHRESKSNLEIFLSVKLQKWVDRFDNKKPVNPIPLMIKRLDDPGMSSTINPCAADFEVPVNHIMDIGEIQN